MTDYGNNGVKRYRKKPVVIEASAPLNAANVQEIARWCGGVVDLTKPNGVGVIIETLEGPLAAVLSDRVLCGVQGEFYPCKPDIFDATYDLVDE